MLNRAYRYIDDEDVFRLRGSLLDKATFNKMLRTIIKTKAGRDLVCRIANECEKRCLPVALTMMPPRKDVLGFCDPQLIVKIGNPNQKDFSQARTNRAIFQQTITLVHELGHALQFLKKEDRLNASLPIKNRFYAQVWAEAEADLWARDVEAELADIYTGLTKNMSLLKTRFKSRSDFVQSFFNKGKNFSLMSSGVEVIMTDLKNAKQITLPNAKSYFYFPKLMKRRFERMRLNLKYSDMPLEKCFWVKSLPNRIMMIHTDDRYALVDSKGQLLVLCNQRVHPATIQGYGSHFFSPLLYAAEKMPISSRRYSVLEKKSSIPGVPFVLEGRQINALAQPLDRFGGRGP